ncbi:TIGR03752 family integrating conjugative element protein [Salmonella enterica subsp. enterica serovar Virchow]|nr:TIGR03752 family integrating conjugative element protein [Salmonella enterica subsp. enterica serovar Virchow]
MATLRSNTLVKVIVPVVAIAAVGIGLRTSSEKNTQQAAPATVLPSLTPEQLRELGVEGDTAQDTLNTLVGKLGDIQRQQGDILKENKVLKEQNEKLQTSNAQVDRRIDEAVSQAQDNTRRELDRQKKSLTDTLDSMLAGLQPGTGAGGGAATGSPGGSDIPVGLGLDGENGGAPSADGYQWVEPQDTLPVDPQDRQSGPPRFATSFLDDNAITQQKDALERNAGNRQSLNNEQEQGAVHPVYTLPENSTLTGSTAMTALLGRIPVNNKVTDPYPFKVLIGRDNLTANGIELPDVEGAIISGTASGDWTLSCVRGDVKSVTFVFSDGTVRTLPAPSGRTGDSDNTNASGDGSTIGWLSDDNGIPCISGTLKSNASTYLPTLGLLALGTGAGDALTATQYTSKSADSGAVTSALTGDAGKAVLGQALGGSFKEVAQWVKERYAQTFDAVYVPPGARVAVHLTRQLNIDYAEKGRRVKYDFSLPGSDTAQGSLD